MRDCITLRLELSNCFWPNGSSERPKSKSKDGSVGMVAAPAVVCAATLPPFPNNGCRDAARVVAFALAICSRKAADDFRLAEAEDAAPSSAGSIVTPAEAVDALNRFRLCPPPGSTEDLAVGASEGVRGGRALLGNSGETLPAADCLERLLAEGCDLRRRPAFESR